MTEARAKNSGFFYYNFGNAQSCQIQAISPYIK